MKLKDIKLANERTLKRFVNSYSVGSNSNDANQKQKAKFASKPHLKFLYIGETNHSVETRLVKQH